MMVPSIRSSVVLPAPFGPSRPKTSPGSTANVAPLTASTAAPRGEVILAEGEGFPLTWRRAEFRPRKTISAAMAMGIFSLMIIVLFIPGNLVQQWKLLPGLLITLWLLLFVPVMLFHWYFKINLKTSLSLYPVKPTHLLGTVLIGLSSLLLTIQLGYLLNIVFPVPEYLKEFFGAELFAGGDTVGGVLFLLFVIAVSPAICEEVLFRGPILSGLRTRLNPWASCLLVGLLFGMFHLNIYRVVPTAVLGVVITYITVRTGTIYLSMLLHFMNNAAAVLLQTGNVPTALADVMKLEQVEHHGLPWPVLAGALAVFTGGIVVVEYTARREPARRESARP